MNKVAFGKRDRSIDCKVDADHKVRIIMLGESGVGKTSLLVRFCEHKFLDEHKCTIGADLHNEIITLNNAKIHLELWDTVGQERYTTMINSYYRKADGVLLVYDMTNHETFMDLEKWMGALRDENREAIVLLVGNKADLRHLIPVSGTTVEKYVRDEELDFCETSAKDNVNVDKVFEKLALKVLERKKIPPFYNDISNGEIEAAGSSNTNSGGEIERRLTKSVSTSSQTDDIPTITLPDDSGANLNKKKKGCC